MSLAMIRTWRPRSKNGKVFGDFTATGNTLRPMPSSASRPSTATACLILAAREESLRTMQPNTNEHFMRHPSNAALAKPIIYTWEKTPAELCDELFLLVNRTWIRDD